MRPRRKRVNRRGLLSGACSLAASAFLPTTAIAQSSLIPQHGSGGGTSSFTAFRQSAFFRQHGTELSDFFEVQFAALSHGFFQIPVKLASSPDESDAYFTFDADRPEGDQSYVIVGDALLERLFDAKFGVEKLLGVLAHELAHSYQVQANFIQALAGIRNHKIKFIELHADYLAGQALAWRAQAMNDAPQEVMLLFYDYGDENYASSQHHGTRAERLISFVAGYENFVASEHTPRTNPLLSSSKGILYIRKASGFN